MSLSLIEERNAAMNRAIEQGEGEQAFEEFYAENIVMMENDQVFEGKEANRQRQIAFANSVETYHSVAVTSSAVIGNISFAEMAFELTFKDGNRITLEEVAVRRWNDAGQIVHERFYYKG
ncbi:MAG: SnoaL-like domain-containing protein [Myxococcota bacterium]